MSNAVCPPDLLVCLLAALLWGRCSRWPVWSKQLGCCWCCCCDFLQLCCAEPPARSPLCCLFGRPLQVTGRTKRCLNLGSYNYLGFAAQVGAQ